MKLKKKLFLYVILSLSIFQLSAQDTFFCELGFSGGCGFVLGDRNDFLFRKVGPLGGAFIKYKINGHYEARLQIEGGVLGINGSDNQPPTRGFVAAQALGEFNFFNYGAKRWEAYYSWVSPSVMTGLGVICFGEHAAATWPMGLGVKFRLCNRINLGAYWIVSKVFSDKLDYADDPLGINGAFWNNRDWYSTAQVYISVNLMKICAPCHDGRLKI